MNSKQEIRRRIRRRRRSLSTAERATAAARVTAVLDGSNVFRAAKRVAFFLSNDGEIDLGRAVKYHDCKQYYLPVVPPVGRRRMRFARVDEATSFKPNRYGILEPVVSSADQMTARELDLILTPLVAFDRRGGRLGMGGGYYDATFSFLTDRVRWHQPKMVGVAFSFQEVRHIERDGWDIPLSAVITESGLIRIA